jgi:hypothetical protein
MTKKASGWASRVASAKASKGGNYIVDGNYLFAVRNLIHSDEFHTGECFVAELEVIESEANVDGIAPNPPGSVASYVVKLSDKKTLDSAMGNIKLFFCALLGEDPANVNDAELASAIDRACEPDQPIKGKTIRDRTYRKTIKGGPNAGKPWTAHNWSYVEQTEEDRAKVRDSLES